MRRTTFLRYLVLMLSAYSMNMQGQVYTTADLLVYEQYISAFKSKKHEPMNELVTATALYFVGKPYVAQTLETENETLVVNLRAFDCFTFVENCIALSHVIKSGDYRFEKYRQLLTAMRYRNGEIRGYTSRLHYTSEWLWENETRGILKDISLDLGGKKIAKPLNFMSHHPLSYPHLKTNRENIELIEKIEDKITKRGYNVVPVAQITSTSAKVQNGDIVVFATTIAGLDYSHIGIAYHCEGKLTFIHASSSKKKIIVETKSLDAYCKQSPKCGGISIVRLK